MTEKEITLLGFKREEMEDDDYYYVYDIAQGFTFLAYSLDMRMLDRTARLGLDSIAKERNK